MNIWVASKALSVLLVIIFTPLIYGQMYMEFQEIPNFKTVLCFFASFSE